MAVIRLALAMAGLLAAAAAVAGPCEGPRVAGAHDERHAGINHDLYCQLRGTEAPAVDATVLFAGDGPRRDEFARHVERVSAWSDRYNRATAEIADVDAARKIAALAGVRRLRRIRAPLVSASGSGDGRFPGVESRAAIAHGHARLLGEQSPSATGRGQRVGVISDSFARTLHMVDGPTSIDREPKDDPVIATDTILQRGGELPARVEIRSDDMRTRATHARDEGAAMAELVHDLAPGAAISFATGAGGPLGLALALDGLCAPVERGGAGVSVVVDDLTYPSAAMFRTGVAGEAAQRCLERGVSVISAAGNTGDAAVATAFRDHHPEADAAAAVADDGTGDYHRWASNEPYLELTVPANGSVYLVLQWNQPWANGERDKAPMIDLDLHVFARPEHGGSRVAASINNQRASSDRRGAAPVEIVRLRNHGDQTETARVAVDHWAGAEQQLPRNPGQALRFRLVAISGEGTLQAQDTERGPALYGHRTLPGVISVGAAPWMATPPYDEPPVAVRNSSARGGTVRRYFDSEGDFVHAVNRVPTLVGADGVNNEIIANTQGYHRDGEPDKRPNFAGTSAAAAVIAGAAAAVRSTGLRNPSQVREWMTAQTVEAKPNRAAGAGFYRVPDSPEWPARSDPAP